MEVEKKVPEMGDFLTADYTDSEGVWRSDPFDKLRVTRNGDGKRDESANRTDEMMTRRELFGLPGGRAPAVNRMEVEQKCRRLGIF